MKRMHSKVAWLRLQAAEGETQNGKKHSEVRNTLLLAIPTMFDLTATILMSVGLLYVTASVYQVLMSEKSPRLPSSAGTVIS